MDIQLKEIVTKEPVRENYSLKEVTKAKVVKEKHYVAEKKELSEDFKSFDIKVEKARSQTPYDYNAISLNKKRPDYSPTAQEMITNPTYNTVGKFLGVDTLHDWGRDYDKVKTIVDWAKEKVGSDQIEKIVDFLNGASNFAPTFGMNHKKIDQIHLYAVMQMQK